MPWQHLRECMRKDGWLWAVLAAAVAVCLVLSSAGGAGQAVSQQEAQLARVLSAMEGAGRVEVAVFYAGEDPLPCGAVVVADGAGDIALRLQMTRAVCTLLGLEANQVDVFRSGGGNP